jgi:hypothetical protein
MTKNLPSTFVCDDADLNIGIEEMSSKDIRFPILRLLQDMSPQVKKKNEKYIEGAEAGMLLDPDSNTLYSGSEGILVIPCACVKSYMQWISRDAGGGLHGVFSEKEGEQKQKTSESLKSRKNAGEQLSASELENIIPDTHELLLHYNYYVFLINKVDNIVTPAIISLSKTGTKAAKTWNKEIMFAKQQKRSMQSIVYKVTSASTSNSKGDYFTWKVSTFGKIEEHVQDFNNVYREAQEFGKGAVEFNKQIDFSVVNEDAPTQEAVYSTSDSDLDGVM